MNIFTRRLLSLTCAGALAFSLSAAAAEEADTAPEAPALPAAYTSAEEAAALLTTQYGAESVQYALMADGEIVKSGHSGSYSRTENMALLPSTLYPVGSVSKMFTTAAVMQLAEEGKLNLDQPLTAYLPGFTMEDARYAEITPRMLLNHSSGLYGTSYHDAFIFDSKDTSAHDNLLLQLANQKLKADPGAYSVYCNDGFTLSELMVEAVSGQSFTDYLRANLLSALGMENTFTSREDLSGKPVAKSYTPPFQNELPLDTVQVLGTGGIFSTAEDLCRLGQALSGDRPEVLSADSAAAMAEPEYQNGIWPDGGQAVTGYGLGWDDVGVYPFGRYDIQAMSKGGDTLFNHASLVVIPEYHMAAAVTSSGGSSMFNQLLAVRMLEQELLERGVIDGILPDLVPAPPVPAEMPEEMRRYAGLYGAAGTSVPVVIEDSTVRIPVAEGTPEQVFQYCGDGKFATADGSAFIRFAEEKNGHTYLYVEGISTVPGLGQTVSGRYDCQKLEENPLSEAVEQSWAARNGKQYYIVNEPSGSQLMIPLYSMKVTVDSGYALGAKILDADHAENVIQIPGTNGRDVFDLRFYEKDGVEYLDTRGFTCVREDGIPQIWDGGYAVCTIQPDRAIRWYTVPETLEGRTLTVKAPENSSFAVYSPLGVCADYSVITGHEEIPLTAGTHIAFLGEPGAVFEMDLLPAQ